MKIIYTPNKYYRLYNAEEAEREFGAVYRSIFLDPDHPRHIGYDQGGALFRNADWKTIGFDLPAWGAFRDTFFPSDPPPEIPQFDKATNKWCPLRPLMLTLVERCTDEIIHASPFLNPDKGSIFAYGVVATPPFEDTSAIASPSVGPVWRDKVGVVFSREGDWALFSDDDYCCVLGAAPALMDQVLELGGGEAFLNRVFDALWESYATSGHHDGIEPYARRCYELLGRPPPSFLGE